MSVRHPHRIAELSLLCLLGEVYYGFCQNYQVCLMIFFSSRACLMRYSETSKNDAAFTIDQDSDVRVRIFFFSSDVVLPNVSFSRICSIRLSRSLAFVFTSLRAFLVFYHQATFFHTDSFCKRSLETTDSFLFT